jgi:hypothetical protein
MINKETAFVLDLIVWSMALVFAVLKLTGPLSDWTWGAVFSPVWVTVLVFVVLWWISYFFQRFFRQ